MRENIFIEKYESEWQQLADYLHYRKASKKAKKQLPKPIINDEDYPACYRRLCNQLALAKTRHFSQHLLERLNHLVVDGHHFLYRRRGLNLGGLYAFLMHDFPVAVRREKKVMLWALASFVVPALAVFLIIQFYPTAAYSFIDESTLSRFERMYEPGDEDRLGLSRDSESDIAMFGLYIFNNISIALRSFAGGLIAGVGAVVTSVFNGVYFGVIFSHLQNVGYAAKTLYPFVITHGAFELTAIIISCGAGMRMGLSLLFPGRYRRGESIARATKNLLPVVIGFVVMLIIAAFIEAFWSAINMPNSIKYFVGTGCWVLVIAYFLLAGRGRES